MKQFLSFIRKEFNHILRDRWTTVILLVLPILMLILFGFAITTEVKDTEVAVFDPSEDVVTREIIQKLDSSEYFVVERYLHGEEEIERTFQEGRIGLIIVFSQRFAEDLGHSGDAQIELIADGTDPNTAVTLTNYATSIIASYRASVTPALRIQPQVKLLYNPGMRSAYNFVPGVMGMILMLICAMMTSVSIAREKELGTMEILLVSPMRPVAILLAKTVPYFLLSIINLATILILSVFILKVPIAGNFMALLVVSLLFIFVSLSLGLLVSSIANSQLVALLISGMAFMMPVVLLSGMMFPIETMPRFLRVIAQIIPARWYIAAVRKVMIKGLGFSSIWAEMSVLGGMSLFFLVTSLKKFKTRLE